jgi:hypothetical protein
MPGVTRARLQVHRNGSGRPPVHAIPARSHLPKNSASTWRPRRDCTQPDGRHGAWWSGSHSYHARGHIRAAPAPSVWSAPRDGLVCRTQRFRGGASIASRARRGPQMGGVSSLPSPRRTWRQASPRPHVGPLPLCTTPPPDAEHQLVWRYCRPYPSCWISEILLAKRAATDRPRVRGPPHKMAVDVVGKTSSSVPPP